MRHAAYVFFRIISSGFNLRSSSRIQEILNFLLCTFTDFICAFLFPEHIPIHLLNHFILILFSHEPLADPANATAVPKAHALPLFPPILFTIHCPVFSMGKGRRKECRSIPIARMPLSWLHGLRLPKTPYNSYSLSPLNVSSIIRHCLHYCKATPYKSLDG